MANYTLVSAPPLAGFDHSFGETRLVAPDDLALVAMAIPLGGERAAKTAVKKGYGVDMPEPGKSVVSSKGNARLIRLASDQVFAIFTHADSDAEAVVRASAGKAFYLTDQTDTWVGLEISGPDARKALERICPIDLHPDAFAINDGARTMMEHLGVIIIRIAEDSYLLLSASSSANSFLHAVETSIINVS